MIPLHRNRRFIRPIQRRRILLDHLRAHPHQLLSLQKLKIFSSLPLSTNRLEIPRSTSERACSSLTTRTFVLKPRLAARSIPVTMVPQRAKSAPRCGVPKTLLP